MNRLLFLYMVASSLICHGMKKSVQKHKVTLYSTYNGYVINTHTINAYVPFISEKLEKKNFRQAEKTYSYFSKTRGIA